jgi:endonuclease/exonuclease/phosphatase family metal-dependent hydrolase
MTWNLWWRFGPWARRQAAIATVIAEAAPDLIGLQEVWVEQGGVNQAEALAGPLGFHVAHGELRFRDGLAFTNAVLSRFPIDQRWRVPLPSASGGPSHRQALAVRVAAPWGPVLFVTTHLDFAFDASATRHAQAAAVCRFVAAHRPDPAEGYPAIVTGDLNAVPDSDEVRALTGAAPVPVPGLAFVDAWVAGGDGGAGCTWHGDNPYLADATSPNRRLDYVLVSWPHPKPLGAIDAARLVGTAPVEGVMPSDHYGVVADLRT